jgi:hypothetical protein
MSRLLLTLRWEKSLTVLVLANEKYWAMNETANPLYFLNFKIENKTFNILNPAADH